MNFLDPQVDIKLDHDWWLYDITCEFPLILVQANFWRTLDICHGWGRPPHHQRSRKILHATNRSSRALRPQSFIYIFIIIIIILITIIIIIIIVIIIINTIIITVIIIINTIIIINIIITIIIVNTIIIIIIIIVIIITMHIYRIYIRKGYERI